MGETSFSDQYGPSLAPPMEESFGDYGDALRRQTGSQFNQYAPSLVQTMEAYKKDQVDWVNRVKLAQGKRPTVQSSITNDDLIRRLEIIKASGVSHYKDDVLEVTFDAPVPDYLKQASKAVTP